MSNLNKRFDVIRFSDVQVIGGDVQFVLSVKPSGCLKFRSCVKKVKMSVALYNWFWKKFSNGDNVGKTGFQVFLEKKGIMFVPGLLRSIVFESVNDGGNYYDLPFKLVMRGSFEMLFLVTESPLLKSCYVDPNTGEETVSYKRKMYQDSDGNWKYSYTSPDYYKRVFADSDDLKLIFK